MNPATQELKPVYQEMAEEVKLYGYVEVSPFVTRVKIALNLKGINYEFIQEDLDNKSPDLLKYNPVYKKVPVLLHNGNPISESLVIIEYIDEVWKGVPIMPNDAYEKAQARFWATFIADKCHPALFKAIRSHGEEQAVAEAHELLQFLENELNVKGTKFFGGDNINLVDICAGYIAHWVVAAEEALGIEVVTKDKFPKIAEWCGNYINCQVVKDCLPPRERVVAYYKGRFGKA
ncbi:putative glutathione transferase [Helianthus annuus]|nr:putative glutathione transferase [Helianthus annuus]